MVESRKFRFVFAITVMAVCLSCGIESYKYIPPVTSVTATLNDLAVIRLPSNDKITVDFTTGQIPKLTVENPTKTFGTDYEIYYRIYLSDKVVSTVNTSDTRSSVNAALASDWTAMEPYTIDSNNYSSSVSSLFTTRKYYSLQLNSSGNLMRSNGSGTFNPVPSDRQFTVTDDLLNTANITDNINADITGMASGTPQYAYTSMYIVMRSFDPLTLTPVFSTPAFVNIFLLPSNIPVISVTGVSVTPLSDNYNPAIKLSAVVSPSTATNTNIEWSLSDNTNAGWRDAGNNTVIVYNKSLGNVNVTVTAKTMDGGYTASSEVILSGIAATGITLDKSDVTLNVSGLMNLSATVMPDNAANKGVTWVSSDTTIASVLSPVGSPIQIRGNAVGSAVITATTSDGTELSASCTVTVTP
jgi:uncharacterized protein YjdB